MIGQFDYRPSQRLALVLGIATLKSSVKMCLITDLSAPHNDKAWSINGLILWHSSPCFRLQLMMPLSLLRKPVGASIWCKWRKRMYFSVRLTFGCHPKTLDSLSEALCWTLINNCKLPFVLHLLDDFWLVNYPNSTQWNVPSMSRFVRRITWSSVMGYFIFWVAHILGLDNASADSLSWF